MKNPIHMPSSIKMPSNMVIKYPIKMPSKIMMLPMKAIKERRKNKLCARNNEPAMTIERNSDSVITKKRNIGVVGVKTKHNEEEETPPPPTPVVEKKSPKSKSDKRKKGSVSSGGDVENTSKNNNCSLGSPPDKPKTRGVRFAPEQDKIHECVPHRSSITRSSRHMLWFDSQDFEDMYYECERTAQKLECGKKLKDVKYSAIGLEAWTEEGQRARTIRKEDAWDAVFTEQYVGYEQGRSVASLDVSSAYQKASEDAKQRAVEAAAGIQNDVERFLTKSQSLKRLIAMTKCQDDSNLHLLVDDPEDGERPQRRDSL